MKEGKFDPNQLWWYVCIWAENSDNFDAFADVIGTELAPDGIQSRDDLEGYDPDYFFDLPQNLQKQCEEWVYRYVRNNDPSELPTHQYLSLSDRKLLKRTTWLVHFSDDAYYIATEGFKKGVDDIGRLGLTSYLSKNEKEYGGYNFAFIANSKSAKFAAMTHKYGSDAVLFQNSGVQAWHFGDEEYQVMYFGPNVNPKNIIYLKNDGGDWAVKSKRTDENLYVGDYEKCVEWVIKNYDQYRRHLTGK